MKIAPRVENVIRIGKVAKEAFPALEGIDKVKDDAVLVIELTAGDPTSFKEKQNEAQKAILDATASNETVSHSIEVDKASGTNPDSKVALPSVNELLRPRSDFKKKDALETYGLEFGIDLNKKKTLDNMYADLVAHVEASMPE